MKKLFLFLCVGLILFGCGSSSDGAKNFIEVKSQTSYQFESAGGDAAIEINSSGKWTVSGETDWCKVSTLSSTNPQKVSIKVSAYTGKDSRQTTLVFACGDKSSSVGILQIGDDGVSYVDMNFDKSYVTTSYDSNSGNVTVDYASGKAVTPAKGKVIVLPAKYNYEIRVVESSTLSGSKVTVATKPGNMGNLFKNISFTLATDASMGGNVILPSKVGYLSKDGVYSEIYRSTDKDATVPGFYSYMKNYASQDLYNKDNNRFYWDKCSLKAKLDGCIYFDFGEQTVGGVKQGDLKEMSITLQGDLTADIAMKYLYQKDFKEKVDELVQDGFTQNYVFTFMVGTTPVHIITKADLKKLVDIDAKNGIDGYTGYRAEGTAKFNLRWSKATNGIPSAEYKPTYTLYTPKHELGTATSLAGKCSYYPEYKIGFYNFDASWFRPVQYLDEQVSSGSDEVVSGYANWSANLKAGLSVEMGMGLKFVANNAEWKSDVVAVNDDALLESPKKVSLVSPKDSTESLSGATVEVKFLVEQYSAITNEYKPCQNVVVEFESLNGLTNNYAVSNSKGEVAVLWKPEKLEKYARIYAHIKDKEGADIDKDSLHIEMKTQVTPAEAVDLGLSVKWASWNIGASAPEQFGECLAWGEFDRKISYSLENYVYWKDVNNDGYATDDEITKIGDFIGGTEYDIAHVQWGGNWRMPSVEELKELIDKCTWEWTSYNGVDGRKVTGPNGNSIFMPAAGFRYKEEWTQDKGFYWTGNLATSYGTWNKAARLYFCPISKRWQEDVIYKGAYIRPVSTK